MTGLGASVRRRAAVLGGTLLVTYAYFYQGGGWGQNTRLDLIRALVERRTVFIDEFVGNTGDFACANDHELADKAPGASFAAVPAFALVRAAMVARGWNPDTPASIHRLAYAATIAGAAIPAALTGVCVFLAALLLGGDETSATVAALAVGIASPLLTYATILWGQALAGAGLSFAFLMALVLGRDPSWSRRREFAAALACGVGAGWAVLSDYTAAVPAVILAAFAIWRVRRSTTRMLAILGVALGGGLALLVLLAYNRAAFGSALAISYAFQDGYVEMKQGFFGIGRPHAHVLYELLFGEYRGLLPLAPAFVLTPVGLVQLWRRGPDEAAAALVVGAIVVYYFVLISGYVYWDGGWAYGPRYIGPTLGLMAIPLATVWWHGRFPGLILALVLVGAINAIACVSVTGQPPYDEPRPMRHLVWPHFVAGELSLNWQSELEFRQQQGSYSELDADHVPRTAFNLGQRARLPGLWSLAPLGAVWLGAGAWWMLPGRYGLRRKVPHGGSARGSRFGGSGPS